MTVSLGVRKIEALLQTDKDLGQRVEVMERALRKKGKRKYFIIIAQLLPPVKLQEPWFGYNLGDWTEEEEQAKWAVMSEHYRTGEWMAQKKQKA